VCVCVCVCTVSATGDLHTATGKALMACDPHGPTMLHVSKQYPRPDCSAFDSFGRVFSGTVRVGDKVRPVCMQLS